MGGTWLLLDRDGVLNRRLPGTYVRHLDEFELLPGALEAAAEMSRRAHRTVVVTNQAGVGHGVVRREELHRIHGELVAGFRRAGGRLDAVLACVHRPEDACGCRKPAPGLFERARRVLGGPEPTRKVMVGDMVSDAAFAAVIGAHFVLIGDESWSGPPPVHHRAANLSDAVEMVMRWWES